MHIFTIRFSVTRLVLPVNDNNIDMSQEDVFNDIKYLFLLAKASGFISSKLKWTSTNRKYLVHESWHYTFSIAFQLVIFVCGFINLQEFLKTCDQASHLNLLFLINFASEIVFTTNFVACCVCSKLYVRRNQDFWQQLYNIDNNLQLKDTMIDDKFVRIIINTHVISTIVFPSVCTGFYVINDAEGCNTNKLGYIAKQTYFFYRSITSSLLSCQYLATFIIINKMLGKLEEVARNDFLINCDSKCQNTLLQIARLYQRICKLARDGNGVISIQLLFEFAVFMCLLSLASLAQ